MYDYSGCDYLETLQCAYLENFKFELIECKFRIYLTKFRSDLQNIE